MSAEVEVVWTHEKRWEQYVHLARLAWLLGTYMGIKGAVCIVPGRSPIVETGGHQVWAVPADHQSWLFRWGQGHEQWVSARDENAAARSIAQVVR